MRNLRLQTVSTLLGLFCVTIVHAQQPQPTAAVPKLVRFSGSFRPANGLPVQSVESVTLAVYRDHTGGDALWQEIQNVTVDADGHYSLLMGATRNEGMPLDLFSSGEPRWLGAQFNRPGETEQPRVLLVSVPYALKASDAETLGGRPASAYLLAGATVGAGASSPNTTTVAKSTKAASPACMGFPHFIAEFVDTINVCDSPIYDANGYIGISTTQPAISLDVRTGSLPQMGIAGNTDYLTFFASDIYGPAIYWDPAKDMRFGKGGVGLYNPYGFVEQMRIQSSTGDVGIGTQAPVAKLEVNGSVQADGNVTIATTGSGLIFPDGTKQTTAGGSITGVTAGTDLTGGGTSGTVTLNLDTTKVPTLAGANSFTGSPNAFTGNVGIGTQTPAAKLEVNGTVQADGNVTIATSGSGLIFPDGTKQTTAGGGGITGVAAGTDLTGGGTSGTVTLNLDTTKVPTLAGANIFTASPNVFTGNVGIGTQSQASTLDVNGNINFSGSVLYQGNPVLQVSSLTNSNTAVGLVALENDTTGTNNTATGAFALQFNTIGSGNTAIGVAALVDNTTGFGNTAIGADAMEFNTTGTGNTASGFEALTKNTTGFENTATGSAALGNNTTGSNNTAIGYGAGVNVTSTSNSIHIGNQGFASDSGTIRIGTPGTQTSFFVAGVRGVTTSNNDAIPVMVDSAGQLGTVSSSRRFKENIADMGAASHDLMRLRPVTYRYKQPFADGSKPIQYGLIAEEVAEVYPDLVAHSADGQMETVKYQVLDSMLLNEVQRQQAEIRRLEERLAKLEAVLSSMSGVAKVSNVQ